MGSKIPQAVTDALDFANGFLLKPFSFRGDGTELKDYPPDWKYNRDGEEVHTSRLGKGMSLTVKDNFIVEGKGWSTVVPFNKGCSLVRANKEELGYLPIPKNKDNVLSPLTGAVKEYYLSRYGDGTRIGKFLSFIHSLFGDQVKPYYHSKEGDIIVKFDLLGNRLDDDYLPKLEGERVNKFAELYLAERAKKEYSARA